MDMIKALNAESAAERLEALAAIKKDTDAGLLPAPETTSYVNNHIHTTYSFSPYSPTKALYMAWQAGLVTAGIMDHDSISGAREFIKAGEILGMPVTCGLECRVDMSGTRLAGRRINNPDQKSVAYCTLHGVPHQNIEALNDYFAPYREKRNKRNRAMTARLSEIFAPYGITLDFERDVLPLSQHAGGGSVTERHLCYALALKMAERYNEPEQLVSFLRDTLGLPLSGSAADRLLAGRSTPQYYFYDVLGVLKSNFVERFYIDADEECPGAEEIVRVASRFGCILCYAYLGDVGSSVTGDKKSQKFEDDYLELLFDEITELGFNAVTYMPSRNSRQQLERVMELARSHGLFQVSGEDINSPRQKFICEALSDPLFAHLGEATWALIGHEKAATADIEDAMFSEKSRRLCPDLDERVSRYSRIGRGMQ